MHDARSAERYDVVIAGGGTAGLALACALADALGPGARIAVVDRVPLRAGAGPRDARASALSAGSKRLLAVLGVWPALAAHAQPVTAVDITDFEPRRRLPPGARVLRQHRRGRRARHLHRRERAAARRPCWRRPRGRPRIALLGGEPAAGFAADEHGVSVDLAGRPRRCARRCWSPPTGAPRALREAAGIGVVGWSYPQIGIVTTVAHEQAAPRPRRAALPARRAVRHPAADGQPLVHHLDGGRGARPRDPGARRCRLPGRGREALRLSPGRRRAGGPARLLAARHASRPRAGGATGSRSSATRRTACIRSPARA